MNAGLRASLLPEARRIVVKVGTRLLTHENGGLAMEQLERVVDQILSICSDGRGPRWRSRRA